MKPAQAEPVPGTVYQVLQPFHGWHVGAVNQDDIFSSLMSTVYQQDDLFVLLSVTPGENEYMEHVRITCLGCDGSVFYIHQTPKLVSEGKLFWFGYMSTPYAELFPAMPVLRYESVYKP